MPDFKSIVVAPVVVFGEHYVALIKRYIMYHCCFITNITALQVEVLRLDDVTYELQERVNTAINNAEAIKPEVVSWLSDSNNLKEEANVILNEVPKVCGCVRVGTRYYLSKRAKMKIEAMTLHREKCKFLGEDVSLPSSRSAPTPIPFGTTYEFDSLRQIEQDIMTTLRVDKEKVLGICGMGGIGKTTMAKRIMNKVLEERVFQSVVMVVVGQRVDKMKIQVEMGEALGLVNLQMETAQTRARKLHERLSLGTYRILLVLDDVWEILDLNNLGIPCEGSRGCTILITSRNSKVLMKWGNEKIFNMEVLSEEDAWFLFRNTVGACVDDISLQAIAKEIVKLCAGLPIALDFIGQVLRDESIVIWKDALRALKSNDSQCFISDCNPFIIRSYDKLESELVKFVFLLCGLFPEDNDIPLDYLTCFCMGLRISKEFMINLDEARGMMSASIKILKSRSLLFDGREEDCVRMHDVVRDACIFIAKEKGYIGGQDCTWMSCSRWTEPGLGFPKLKLLYLISDSVEGGEFKMDDSFFQGMRDLNVLYIENYSWTSLPRTTQLLINIRTLLLVSCPNLETISVAGDLVNLEILICRDCGSIQELPLEIKSFNRLKLLELSGCQQLRSIGGGVISGTDLEEICDIDVPKNPTELILKSLPALKHLWQSSSSTSNMNVVSIFNQLSCIYISGCHELCNLFSLSAVTTESSGSCLLQLERLVIESCGMMEQVFLWNEEERNVDITLVFPKLKFLSLISLPMLTSFCKGNESFEFPLLARMRITSCPLLVLGNFVSDDESPDDHYDDDDSTHLFSKPDKKKSELWINQPFGIVTNLSVEGDVDRDVDLQLPQNMSRLSFKECSTGMKLVNMAKIATVFPLLEVLQLLKLSEVEKMEFDDTMPSNSLQNLRELRLQSLQALKHLWQSSSSPSQMIVASIFNQLSSICIYGCNGLSNLFSLSMIARGSCLLQLEKLEIESCEMMEQVFLWNEESEKQMISNDIPQLFPKLKVLILDSLPRLMTICQGTKSLEFPLLAQMKISRCPLLENLVSTGGWSLENHDDQSHKLAIAGKSCISHLQILNIEECEMFEHVFVHKNQRGVDIKTLVFSELKSLSLKSLPWLSSLSKGIESYEFPLLDNIQINDCPILKSIDTINLFNKPDKVEMELWKNQPFKTSEYLSLEGDAKRNLDFRFAQNMRCLSFRECERGAKLVNMTTMDDLFPRLEVLRLLKLTELQEIWDIDDDGSIPDTCFKNLKELRLEFLPALNHLWKSSNTNSPYVVSIFSQLSSIYIYGCHSLRNLFALPGMTTTGSCTFQLEKLVIASCDMMEQVFLCTEGENQISLHFPKLKVLILDSLPKLTSLSKGTKISDLHLLDRNRISISRCPLLLEIFDTPYQDDRAGDDDYVHLFCKPYNKVQEKMELRVHGNISVGNKIDECVEYMSFEGDGSRILDVDDQVGQSMRCLILTESSMNMTTIATVFPLLEVMWLVDITDLEEICDIDGMRHLKELRVKSLPALKHLRQFDTSPSQINAVSIFNQLSCIYIYGCHGLCNLFSLSAMTTASGSCLSLLERLVIESCDMMEQVFLWNEEERNDDITLVFPKLKFLSLTSLPMLTRFCKGNESLEFPLLARMRITRCPMLVLGNFVSDHKSPDYHEDDGGDDSIHLLSKPDKKKSELWINQPFGKVTNLSLEGDVDRDLDLQLPHYMSRLSFKECSTGMKLVNMAEIATVFPLLEVLQLLKLSEVEKMEFDDPMPSNSLQNLRELRLQSLQALKHLWQSRSSSPSQTIVASIFNQLSSICIYACNGLSNIFSLSMIARGSCLLQLEKLEIESCEMMEQAFMWNEESEKQRSIHVGEFPKLNFLRLSFLPRLTDFCRGIKRIECPLLTEVKIVNCPKLRSSFHLNGKHSLIFNSSKSVQHQRAKDTNSAMQLRRPGKEEKGKKRLEDSSNEIEEL